MIAGSSSPLVTSLSQELIRGVHRSGGRPLERLSRKVRRSLWSARWAALAARALWWIAFHPCAATAHDNGADCWLPSCAHAGHRELGTFGELLAAVKAKLRGERSSGAGFSNQGYSQCTRKGPTGTACSRYHDFVPMLFPLFQPEPARLWRRRPQYSPSSSRIVAATASHSVPYPFRANADQQEFAVLPPQAASTRVTNGLGNTTCRAVTADMRTVGRTRLAVRRQWPLTIAIVMVNARRGSFFVSTVGGRLPHA
jgi:hypothetical protein